MAGRKFRAFVRRGAGASVEELKMLPLDDDRVVVRTQASQCCYTLATEVLGNAQINPARIPGHGGVGVVEAVGSRVRRVRVGDVVVVDGPYCGQCYMCLHGRADRCQMSSGRRRESCCAGSAAFGRNSGGSGEQRGRVRRTDDSL
jgi:S-(hydroxymethyl)glutathione dehydrogenase/alcohol dehydrogenase